MEKSELNEYDWREVFAYAGDGTVDDLGPPSGFGSVSACLGSEVATGPVLRAEVARIIAASEGENDGNNWLIVTQQNDGRFAFVSAGCDYTGWDCRAGGHCIVAHDLAHLIRFGLGEEDRQRLSLPLEPEQREQIAKLLEAP